MARVVLAARELWPFVQGGGIGRYMWSTARRLRDEHEVTLLTSSAHREAAAAVDPTHFGGIELAFADEPAGDVRPFSSWAHAWSARLLEAVAGLRPDVVEFADYVGEGFATVHARSSDDRRLRATLVAVRAHGSGEIVTALNEDPPLPANGITWALERFAIRHADALLWPGGDVLDRYRAFYGSTAPPVRLGLPVERPGAGTGDPAPDAGPLRLVFLNKVQRNKGVLELVEAMLRRPDADVELTVIGGDTPSGPGGRSMAAHLARLAGGDERVRLRAAVPHEEVATLMRAHHAVVVPTRWETFSYVTREALAVNRPVLARPVGAIPEVVQDGRSGWLFGDLDEALGSIDAAAARTLIEAGGPRAALDDEAGREDHAAAYRELAGRAHRKRRAAGPPPRLAAVVAVPAGGGDVRRTLASLAAQRGARVAVTLVCAPEAAAGVAALADRLIVVGDEHPGGRAAEPGASSDDHLAAWAAGLAATQEERVLLLTAGTELEPAFAARTAGALQEPFVYATALGLAKSRRAWHRPLGGEDLAAAGVDAGVSVALVRRDAALAALARAPATERELWTGLSGAVVHERLVRRLPHRPADDRPAPGRGEPDPGAVARAFGDVLPVVRPGAAPAERSLPAAR